MSQRAAAAKITPEQVIEVIDRYVDKGSGHFNMQFDDDEYDREFPIIVAAAKAHVLAKGYDNKFDFWEDGCNYGNCAMICGRTRTTQTSHGYFWPGSIWRTVDSGDDPL